MLTMRVIFFSLAIILCGIYPSNALSNSIDSPEVTLISSTESEAIIELAVPVPDITKIRINGNTFHKFSIAGMGYTSEIGKPQLPMKAFLIGVPKQTTDVAVDVLEYEEELMRGFTVIPVPNPVFYENIKQVENPDEIGADWQWEIDENVYCHSSPSLAKEHFYPSNPAFSEIVGFLRNQKVAQLTFYPVQYNPVKRLIKFYKRLRVKVNFIEKRIPHSPSTEVRDFGYPHHSPEYESLYKNVILNYDTAKAWRFAPLPLAPKKGIKPFFLWSERLNLSQAAYKIYVEEDGIYELSYDMLRNVGLNLNKIDPQKTKIFNLGIQMPIYVRGEDDGKFDIDDYVLFYGEVSRSKFTRWNIYWLLVDNDEGLRMDFLDSTPDFGIEPLTAFKNLVRFEENNIYRPNIPSTGKKELWFWELITAPKSIDFPFTLTNLADIDSDALITVALQGLSAFPNVSLDHHTLISMKPPPLMGGVEILDFKWDGRIEHQAWADVPQKWLREGENKLTVTLPGDTAADVDVIFLDWIEVEYMSKFSYKDKQLLFSIQEPPVAKLRGTKQTGEAAVHINRVGITNFIQDEIEIFDVTAPFKVARITNIQVKEENGKFTASFQADTSDGKSYLALLPKDRIYPQKIVKNTPSNLYSSSNAADYIIITHKDFLKSIQPLASFHKSRGLRVKIVDVEDVYDFFNYGLEEPHAIKSFLKHAYEYWLFPAPAYVLLVGDATYDYRGYLKTESKNYVPTYPIITPFVETASDNWFAAFWGDDFLPDMFIGRLPAKTSAQADAMVEKIFNYQQNPSEGNWRKNVIFIADNPEPGLPFEADTENLIENYLPKSYNATRVYLSQCLPDKAACTRKIIEEIDSGGVILNFVGHGALLVWSKKEVFKSEQIASLKNEDRLLFAIMSTCLNGYFFNPEYECMAEEFIRAEGRGSVASWASSDFTFQSGLNILNQELFLTLFKDGNNVIGKATTAAKFNLSVGGKSWRSFVDTFILFADPAMELALPKPKVAAVDEEGEVFPPITSATPPQIAIEVKGLSFVDGDFVESKPTFLITISCKDEIELSSIRLFLNDKKFTISSPEVSFILNDEAEGLATHGTAEVPRGDIGNDNPAREVYVQFRPILQPSRYTLRVEATNIAGQEGSAYFRFLVAAELNIEKIINYPNPMKDRTDFTFILSKPAEVTIKIYTVTGRLIKTLKKSASASYNEIFWDGTDEDGHKVANGVYLYKVIAENGEGKISFVEKLVVMR